MLTTHLLQLSSLIQNTSNHIADYVFTAAEQSHTKHQVTSNHIADYVFTAADMSHKKNYYIHSEQN